MLLNDLTEHFLLSYEGICSETTVRWYIDRFKPLISRLGNCNIEQIEIEDLRYLYRDLSRKKTIYEDHPHPGRKPKEKEYSVYSLHSFARSWKRLFKWALEEGYLQENPAKRLKLPILPKPDPKALRKDDLIKLLFAARESSHPERDEAILRFLADTSARVGGASHVRMKDIILEERQAIIREKGRGGNGETRTVYFTPSTAHALTKWLAKRPSTKDERLFLLSDSGVYQAIERLGERLKVQGPHNPHAFRHGFAVGMLAKGANLSQVSRLMGHKSIFVTDWYYGHFPNKELQTFHEKYNWMPSEDEIEKSFAGIEDHLASGGKIEDRNGLLTKMDQTVKCKGEDDEILTIPKAIQLAEEMGYKISASTIYYAAREENIRGARKYGRDWVFQKKAFLYWLHARYNPKKPKN